MINFHKDIIIRRIYVGRKAEGEGRRGEKEKRRKGEKEKRRKGEKEKGRKGEREKGRKGEEEKRRRGVLVAIGMVRGL